MEPELMAPFMESITNYNERIKRQKIVSVTTPTFLVSESHTGTCLICTVSTIINLPILPIGVYFDVIALADSVTIQKDPSATTQPVLITHIKRSLTFGTGHYAHVKVFNKTGSIYIVTSAKEPL